MTDAFPQSAADVVADPPSAVAAAGAPPRRRLRALVVLALLIAVAYGASLRNSFVFDDAIFVERDVRLQTLEGVRRLFSEPLWGFTDKHGQRSEHQYYRPLQLVAPAAAKMWLGGAAWPVHLTSLVLHLLCSFMVYELVARALARSPGGPVAPRVDTLALLLAALFAVHPANSEAVLWASDLSGLGATACLLAVVLLHVSAAPRLVAALAIAALSLVAMLFKESGVLAPALMALFDFFLRRRVRVLDYLGALVALAAYLELRVHALGALLPGAGSLELGPVELAINAVALVPSYVATFLWPFELNMYRDFTPVTAATDWRFVVGAVLATGAAIAILATRRARPLLALGLAWAGLTASPWLFVRWPQLNAFAERYLYLPSIGIYLAAAALLAGARLGRAATTCAIALIAAFVVRDAVRTLEWKDEITIYTKTLEQSPRAELIRNNLSLRYLESGDPARGIPIQQELLRIAPTFPSGWHNMGLLLLAAGRRDEARDAFEKSATLEPFNAATALNLGYVYDLAGERERAVAQYFVATMLDAHDAKPWYNLAVIALEEGQLENAKRALGEALARAPDDRAAQGLRAKIAGLPPRNREPDPAATLKRCNDARADLDAGRTRLAIAKLEMAGWLDERAHVPHHFLANVRYLNGQYREALREEGEALARDPGNALYRANFAALEQLLTKGKDAGAAPTFR
jgi:tetratricopeptide (TPR) repeat protein